MCGIISNSVIHIIQGHYRFLKICSNFFKAGKKVLKLKLLKLSVIKIKSKYQRPLKHLHVSLKLFSRFGDIMVSKHSLQFSKQLRILTILCLFFQQTQFVLPKSTVGANSSAKILLQTLRIFMRRFLKQRNTILLRKLT